MSRRCPHTTPFRSGCAIAHIAGGPGPLWPRAMVVSLKEVRFLDRPAARLCAVGVALLTAVPLAVMHRDDLFPPERAAVNADDPVARCLAERGVDIDKRSEEHTSELQSLMRISYAVFCLKKKTNNNK